MAVIHSVSLQSKVTPFTDATERTAIGVNEVKVQEAQGVIASGVATLQTEVTNISQTMQETQEKLDVILEKVPKLHFTVLKTYTTSDQGAQTLNITVTKDTAFLLVEMAGYGYGMPKGYFIRVRTKKETRATQIWWATHLNSMRTSTIPEAEARKFQLLSGGENQWQSATLTIPKHGCTSSNSASLAAASYAADGYIYRITRIDYC